MTRPHHENVSSDFDVHEVLEDAVEIVAARAGAAGRRITLHVAAGVPERLHGAAWRLRHAAALLLERALGGAGGGDLLATLRRVRGAEGIVLSFAVTGAGVELSKELPFEAARHPATKEELLAGRRVLLVSAHAPSRAILTRALATRGAAVRTAAGVAEALAVLRQGVPGAFDCVVLDRETDGRLEVAWALARDRRLPEVPVVVLASAPLPDPAPVSRLVAWPGTLASSLAEAVHACILVPA